MTVERLRWSVLDTDIMWAKEKDSTFPVDYRLLGNQQYLQRVVTKLKNTDLAVSISDIRKCGTE